MFRDFKKYYNSLDKYKKASWLYLVLLFVEGAMRKWFMPSLSNVRLLAVKEYSYRYELSNKSYYRFSVDKFIAQQVSYKKAMDVVCKSDIGSFKTVIDEAKKTCFVLFLKSLSSQRDFVEGIRRYRTIEKDYSFLYTDFMHAIYYFIIISLPSVGYYMFYRNISRR